MAKDEPRAARELALYLRGVKDPAQLDGLRERLAAIKSLAGAKSERTVKADFYGPHVHRVPPPN